MDKQEDRDSWWERRETLKLLGDGGFDWIVETSCREGSAVPPQHEIDRTTGRWQVVGTGEGPHYLQLIAGNGDMYSFAAMPGSHGEHLLNNKTWQRSHTA